MTRFALQTLTLYTKTYMERRLSYINQLSLNYLFSPRRSKVTLAHFFIQFYKTFFAPSQNFVIEKNKKVKSRNHQQKYSITK